MTSVASTNPAVHQDSASRIIATSHSASAPQSVALSIPSPSEKTMAEVRNELIQIGILISDVFRIEMVVV